MATIANLYPLLKEMGLDDEKSRDFIETIEESFEFSLEKKIEHLVTKEDLLLTKEDLKKEISDIREEISDVREEISDVKGELKGDIINLKVDMIKWAIGLLLGQTALIFTIFRLFFIK